MEYKFLSKTSSLFKVGSSTLAALSLSILPSFSQTISFSLATDTWSYSSGSPTTGFVNQTPAGSSTNSSGYTTKSGVKVNFGATFVGGAQSSSNSNGNVGSSMTVASGNDNPNGFILGTQNNNSSGIPSGEATALSGNITRYQRWYFEFSQAVILDSFILEDIDNGSFRDIVAAEAHLESGYVSAFPSNTFTTSLLPLNGTGIDTTYILGSSLSTGTLEFPVAGPNPTILAVAPNNNTGNPSSTPEVRANVTFGSTPIRAFSVYAISNQNNDHRMALNNNSFQVTIPEPSVSLLGLLSTVGFLARRRR